MLATTTWLLVTAVSLIPILGEPPTQIDVDCDSERALVNVLARAKKLGQVELTLHGVCRGHFVIATDGVTLRGATPESGLAAPLGHPGLRPVLEVVDTQVRLRELSVQGGVIGIYVHGWDAEADLHEVEVHEQEQVGVVASSGAHLRLTNSTVHDCEVGVSTEDNSTAYIRDVVITDHRLGLNITDKSSATLLDTTIENSQQTGLGLARRSDVTIQGGTFRENGQVHISATDWSSIKLLFEVTIGSDTDGTGGALNVGRQATLSSYTTSDIYGDVSALDGGSIGMGNTVVHGNMILSIFSNAYIRDSEITELMVCLDGSDAICDRTTTGGVIDCASSTCSPPVTKSSASAPTVPEIPEFTPRKWKNKP